MITNEKEKYELMLIYSTFNELVGYLKQIKIEDYIIEDDTTLQFLLTATNNRIIDFDNLLWDNEILGSEE